MLQTNNQRTTYTKYALVKKSTKENRKKLFKTIKNVLYQKLPDDHISSSKIKGKVNRMIQITFIFIFLKKSFFIYFMEAQIKQQKIYLFENEMLYSHLEQQQEDKIIVFLRKIKISIFWPQIQNLSTIKTPQIVFEAIQLFSSQQFFINKQQISLALSYFTLLNLSFLLNPKFIYFQSKINYNMRRELQQLIQTEAPPQLKEKLDEQLSQERRQDQQVQQNTRNFIIVMLINLKNSLENSVAFLFTMAFLIPLWIFKTILKCFDLVERCLRFVLWLHVKGIVLVINFVYKLLQYFGISTAVNFFKRTVKKYFGNYSTDQTENFSGTEALITKKQHNLIDVKKVEKKIRTPNIFLSHQESSKNIWGEGDKQGYVERINRDLVPERIVHQNIVETSYRLKSPQLLTLSGSHFTLKRNSTEPNLLSSARLENQISLNREQTSPIKIMEPDRDISSERYNKTSLLNFKKKETPEKQILMLHHHKFIQGTKTEKQILEQQLLTLRTKMQDLINQNNQQIHELQTWIQEKSETIIMTRKENLELLTKIEELQRENIKKNQKFTQLQSKIKQMEEMLEKQKSLRHGLNSQVEKLEEEIKTKTIEIMSLKDKITKNFMHLQQMENIFGSENLALQTSPQQQAPTTEQIEDSTIDLKQSVHSLKKELNEIEIYDISNHYLPTVKKMEEIVSNMKEMDEIPNPNEIEEIQKPHKTESQIQQIEKIIPGQNIENISIPKLSAPALYQETSITKIPPIQQLNKQSPRDLVKEAEDFLIKEQESNIPILERQSNTPIHEKQQKIPLQTQQLNTSIGQQILNPIASQNLMEQSESHGQQEKQSKKEIEQHNLIEQQQEQNVEHKKTDQTERKQKKKKTKKHKR